MFKRLCFILLILLMAASVGTAREFEGVDMPETLKVGNRTVALNGVGLRQILFLKPYVGGLYLKAAETEPEKIMKADEAMAIRLEMISGTNRGMFLRAFKNGMRGSTQSIDASWEAIEARYESFIELLPDDIEEGDVFEFKYVPGEGLQVIKNDELRGAIEGLDFKTAFFGIWLNEDSPADEDLKQAMLAGDVRVAIADIQKEEEKMMASAEAEMKAAEEKAKAEAEAAGMKAEEEAAKATAAAEEKARMEAEKAAAEKAAAEAEMKAEQEAAKKAAKEAAAKAAAEKEAAEAAAAAEKKAAEEKARMEMAAAEKRAEKEMMADVTLSQVVDEDIYFGYNDASLSGESLSKLSKKAAWLKANPEKSVAIEVYCDPRGSKEYNMWLAEKRGQSVKTYLVNAGIDASRLDLVIYGEENLKYSEKENWAKNRRAHFKVK